jgi:hypothetical protein
MGRYIIHDLPQYSSVGSYPLVYLDRKTYEFLCAECATNRRLSEKDAGVRWEGPDEPCQDCGRSIESAYGAEEEDNAEVHSPSHIDDDG